MRFCGRPFHFVWVTRTFDETEQSLTLPCAWLNIPDAQDTDLFRYSMEEVWNSRTFEKVRHSVLDGSFRYCNCNTCPFLSNGTLEDLDEDEFLEKAKAEKYPTYFDLAYDRSCNHACPSCRDVVYRGTEKNREYADKISKKLLPYLNKAVSISSNGQGDFFASSINMRLFEQLHPENPDLKISIETNGVLFDKEHWERIRHLSKYEVSVYITPSSFERSTYAYLSGGFDHLADLERNLFFVKHLRDSGEIHWFTIVTVVQDTNVKEIPQFIQKCLDVYQADEVITRPIYKWNFLSEEDFWFKNVANPMHPYHQYYEQLLASDIMKHPKVYNWDGSNEHPAQRHPAYIYKEIAETLKRFLSIGNVEKKLEEFFKKQKIEKVILYGTDLLGHTVRDVLNRTNIRIVQILCKENLGGYSPSFGDSILICNFYHIEPIMRDLEFTGFQGKLFRLDQVLETLESEDENEERVESRQ